MSIFTQSDSKPKPGRKLMLFGIGAAISFLLFILIGSLITFFINHWIEYSNLLVNSLYP